MKIRVKTRAAVLGIRALAASRRVARAAPSRNAARGLIYLPSRHRDLSLLRSLLNGDFVRVFVDRTTCVAVDPRYRLISRARAERARLKARRRLGPGRADGTRRHGRSRETRAGRANGDRGSAHSVTRDGRPHRAQSRDEPSNLCRHPDSQRTVPTASAEYSS